MVGEELPLRPLAARERRRRRAALPERPIRRPSAGRGRLQYVAAGLRRPYLRQFPPSQRLFSLQTIS